MWTLRLIPNNCIHIKIDFFPVVLDNKTLLLWGLHILNFSSSPLSDLVSYASWVGGSFFPGGPLDISKFHFYFLQQAIRSSPTLGSCFSLESTTVKSLTPGVLAVQCCIINHPKHKHLFCLGLCPVVRAQQGQLVLPPWYLSPQLGDLNNGAWNGWVLAGIIPF